MYIYNLRLKGPNYNNIYKEYVVEKIQLFLHV